VRPFAAIVRLLRFLKGKYITNSGQPPKISETREKNPTEAVIPGLKEETLVSSAPALEQCPYCKGKDVVKRGLRQKKYEKAQLYFCNRCNKTFTGQKVKGKSFPLATIFEGLSRLL
jgi:ribosomal protein L37AE/L43A